MKSTIGGLRLKGWLCLLESPRPEAKAWEPGWNGVWQTDAITNTALPSTNTEPCREDYWFGVWAEQSIEHPGLWVVG